MSTPSFSAIKMLGDMLVEQEQRINDANPETDEQLQQDLEDVKELWKHYQFLMIDPIKDAVYKHSFNIRDWVLDQVADADLELSPKQVDYLAHYLYQNFDFSTVWDQLDAMTFVYLESQNGQT